MDVAKNFLATVILETAQMQLLFIYKAVFSINSLPEYMKETQIYNEKQERKKRL